MITDDDEIDMGLLMEIFDDKPDKVVISFGYQNPESTEKCWFYTVNQVGSELDKDAEIVHDVDLAFNIVQKRNIELSKKRLDI